MALYEFVLQFPDRQELRLGDRAPRVGDMLCIGGRRWTVGAKVAGGGRSAGRFLLQPARRAESALEQDVAA